MLNPFIDLLAAVIQLYTYCVIAWFVLTMLISFKIVNRQQTFVMQLNYALNRLCGPVLYRIRKIIPDLGTIDISPVILILLLGFLKSALYHYFYNL
jgi:YggT family protein